MCCNVAIDVDMRPGGRCLGSSAAASNIDSSILAIDPGALLRRKIIFAISLPKLRRTSTQLLMSANRNAVHIYIASARAHVMTRIRSHAGVASSHARAHSRAYATAASAAHAYTFHIKMAPSLPTDTSCLSSGAHRTLRTWPECPTHSARALPVERRSHSFTIPSVPPVAMTSRPLAGATVKASPSRPWTGAMDCSASRSEEMRRWTERPNERGTALVQRS